MASDNILSESGKKRITGEFRELGAKDWFKGGEKDFFIYAQELMDKGYTEEEAIDFLERVNNTVCKEYGD